MPKSLSLNKKTNVTFCVNSRLLQEARKKASELDLSLNDAFLDWLGQFARGPKKAAQVKKLFKDLSHVSAGRKFTRDDCYE